MHRVPTLVKCPTVSFAEFGKLSPETAHRIHSTMLKRGKDDDADFWCGCNHQLIMGRLSLPCASKPNDRFAVEAIWTTVT